MSKINKVLYNVDQTADTSEAERRLARKNIGLDEVIGHATTADDTGIAPLGKNGLVPAEYLPSFVNAVVNGYYYNGKFYREATHTTEISPDENTTYVDITVADVGVGYRWTQASGYFQISSQNAFGALKAGNDTIHADKPMDLLTIVGDSGITVAVADTRSQEQNGSDKLTIGHSNSIVAGRIGEESPTAQINNTFNLPWASFDAQGHITAAGSNAITIKNATTGQYGVTKLTSTPGTDETLAMTPKGVQTAIAALDANVGSTGGTNVALTVTEADGVITGVSITKDDTAKASHAHGNITSDGKVTTAAASKKGMLITNSSDQVVTGPAFGTASGDDALFLNKQGNWSGINEATSSTRGGIKIGYTQSGTNYPVKLSSGKAYVTVPLPGLASDSADGLLSSSLYTKLNDMDSVRIITSDGGNLSADALAKLQGAASDASILAVFREYNFGPALLLKTDSSGYHFVTPVSGSGVYYTYDISLNGVVTRKARSIGVFKYDTSRREATWNTGVATITLPTNNCYYYDCYMDIPDESGDQDCGLTIDLGTLPEGEAPNIECQLWVRNTTSSRDAGKSVRVSVKYRLSGDTDDRFATNMEHLGTGGYITIPDLNYNATYSISVRGGHMFVAN